MLLTVHIVPLGWEVDRVVEVLKLPDGTGKLWPCTKMHLVVPGKENAKTYPEKVREAVKALGAEVAPIHYVDKYRTVGGERRLVEFEEVLGKVAELIRKEAVLEGRKVLINISACSKVSALAAGVAAMSYQYLRREGRAAVSLYYVSPKHYAKTDDERREHGEGVGFEDARSIDLFPIVLPDAVRMNLLGFLKAKGGTASFQDCMTHLEAISKSGIKAVAYGMSSKLRNRYRNRFRRLFDPMKKDGYLLDERDSENRRERRLVLTEHGKTVALLSNFKR